LSLSLGLPLESKASPENRSQGQWRCILVISKKAALLNGSYDNFIGSYINIFFYIYTAGKGKSDVLFISLMGNFAWSVFYFNFKSSSQSRLLHLHMNQQQSQSSLEEAEA